MIQRLEKNWSTGEFVVRGKRIKNETPKNSSEFILLDRQWVLIGIKSCGSIKVLNRKSLEFEQVFLLRIPNKYSKRLVRHFGHLFTGISSTWAWPFFSALVG